MLKDENAVNVLATPQKFEVKTQSNGNFSIDAEGMSEDFLLNAIRILTGKEEASQKAASGNDSYVTKSDLNTAMQKLTYQLKKDLAPKAAATKPTVKKPIIVKKAQKNIVEGTPRPKTLPLIKDDVTSVYKSAENPPFNLLGEKLSEVSSEAFSVAGVDNKKENVQDYYHTGVKYDREKPRYRCSYVCPKCGESGRHYIPTTVMTVSCHQCQAPLIVQPATEKGFGTDEEHRDEYGNFFVATELDFKRLNHK